MVNKWKAMRPVFEQLAGGGAAAVGVYLAFGLAVALMAGGLAVAALGALREAGRI